MYLEKEHTAHRVSSHQSPGQMRISRTVFQIRARGKEQGRESLAVTASFTDFSVLGTTAKWVRQPAPLQQSQSTEMKGEEIKEILKVTSQEGSQASHTQSLHLGK